MSATEWRDWGGEGGREKSNGGSGSILNVVKDILSRKLGQDKSKLSLVRLQLQARQVRCERDALLLFCQTFQTERQFSQLPYSHRLTKLLHLLQRQRVCDEWMMGGGDKGEGEAVEGGEGGEGGEGVEGGEGGRAGDHVRCVLMTLRLLLRDEAYQRKFMEGASPLPTLAKCLEMHADAYLNGSLQITDTLKELTNIFQKLSSSGCHGEGVVGVVPEVLVWLVRLLRVRDLTLTQCCLCALINVSKSVSGAEAVSSLSPLPSLLHILQLYDPSSRRMAADLVLLLASHSGQTTQSLKELDGLPLCLRLLHSNDLHILHRMVSVVERLCEDRELQDDLRLLGGVPLLLTLLSKTVDYSSGNTRDKLTALKSASCSAITQLSTNDTNSHHFVQGNGVYLLAKLVLLDRASDEESTVLAESLQRHAWRALRYLYSTERNRRHFRRLFPPKLFESFIDIGHYVRESAAYTPLVTSVNSMTPAELTGLQSAIEEANPLRSPLFSVGGYYVQELLGSGAFGNVYKVRKKASDTFLAMKEIKSSIPLLGKTGQERASSIGKIMNEVNIVKEQLHHPNVVHYHKCFEEGGHLYIVMELIEGASLCDCLTSMAEKKERFEEDRIWRIFTQLALALRYLHKEKRVTHRDLTPSNLMLGETDKLTITDFGLAKQKQREFSVMQSTVGTMAYWCPELVRSEPYTEKADIWAAGCILYQMATLRVPFQTTNILALAKKIAEVDYPAIPDGFYSALLSDVISRCLTGDPSCRPDSVDLGALVAGQLMREADRLAESRVSLQNRLDRERQRTLRHQQRYLHLASQSSLATPTDVMTTPTSTHRAVGSSRRNGPAGSTRRRISDSFTAHPPLVTSPTTHSPIITRGTPSHPHNSPSTTVEPHPPLETPGMEWGFNYSPALFHKWSGMGTDGIESGQSLEWDRDSDSNESVFHEASLISPLNVVSTDKGYHSDAYLEGMTSSPGTKRENPFSSRQAHGRSHSAVIPGQVPRPWQSGRGHGTFRSQTASTGSGRSLPGVGGASAGSPLRHRTPSSSSVLSLSSRHFREISDPITQLLGTLQRLLSLSQSTPASHAPSVRMLVLDRYQRSLFQPGVSPAQIKGELHRLETYSGEGVWLLEEGEWSIGPRLLRKAMEELAAHCSSSVLSPPPPNRTSTDEPCTLTYDLLATMIDSLHDEQGTPLIK